MAGVMDPLYQVQTFTRAGESYVAFLASDEAGTTGTPLLHGIAPLSHLPVPETIASWRAFQFGAADLTIPNEAILWGNAADPDDDGIANLLEYALTTPPLAANPQPITAGESNGRLTLTFPGNPLRLRRRLPRRGLLLIDGGKLDAPRCPGPAWPQRNAPQPNCSNNR